MQLKMNWGQIGVKHGKILSSVKVQTGEKVQKKTVFRLKYGLLVGAGTGLEPATSGL